MSDATSPAPDAWRRARLKLLGLGLFFVLPVLAATLAWWFDWSPGATANYGTLVPPKPVVLPQPGLLKGKWVLVQFDATACGEACERKLYIMRQARRATGREMDRVARLWLTTDEGAVRPELLAAIEGTVVAPQRAVGDPAANFPAEGALTDHLFLVDPLGNVMMRFPKEPDPNRLIKDLQRVLRLSRFG